MSNVYNSIYPYKLNQKYHFINHLFLKSGRNVTYHSIAEIKITPHFVASFSAAKCVQHFKQYYCYIDSLT